jgi:homoserine kinase
MIRAFAPATVANIAAGFDIFGLAIHHIGDVAQVQYNDENRVRIVKITGDNGKLPTDPAQNTAAVAVQKLLDFLGRDVGIDIVLEKKMPLNSGLGSSAASAVAAVVAANALLGNVLTKKDLLPFAMEGERVACGAAIADNAAACLLGGIVLVQSYAPLCVVNLAVPPQLWVAVAHPHISIKTADARAVLPTQLPMATAVAQWGQAAGFVAALYQNNYDLLAASLHDFVAEPHRSALIPQFAAVQRAALAQGALGCSISGAGPSVFALCKGEPTAIMAGNAMQNIFIDNNMPCDLHISAVNQAGAVILDK